MKKNTATIESLVIVVSVIELCSVMKGFEV